MVKFVEGNFFFWVNYEMNRVFVFVVLVVIWFLRVEIGLVYVRIYIVYLGELLILKKVSKWRGI